MPNITLSLAIGDYDHVRDLLDGKVRAEGVDVVPLRLPVEEIFYRFTQHREWDVSEMSFAKYASLASQADCDLTAIPVFPSRAFRHSSIYVRADSTLRSPADLGGRRVGVPEWAQTAAIYTRGLLAHEYGVDLASIEWFQAGVNQAGRAEKVALKLPPRLRLTPVPERSLSELLLEDKLDAVLSARPPQAFTRDDGRVRRLFPDYREAELAYWRKTGIFPIMHVVALKRDLLDRHPWLATNLVKAFTEAKDRSLTRASDITASFFPLPWIEHATALSREMLGADFWPYGIEPNRTTLEAFLSWAWEQGVCHRRLAPEDLFPRSVLGKVRV